MFLLFQKYFSNHLYFSLKLIVKADFQEGSGWYCMQCLYHFQKYTKVWVGMVNSGISISHPIQPPAPATLVNPKPNSEVWAGSANTASRQIPCLLLPTRLLLWEALLEILESPLFLSGCHHHARAHFLFLRHICFLDTKPPPFLYSQLWFQEQVRVDFSEYTINCFYCLKKTGYLPSQFWQHRLFSEIG